MSESFRTALREALLGEVLQMATELRAERDKLIAAVRERDAEIERLRLVAAKARALVEAADACDREAERPAPSRSSAPMVFYIRALAKLRDALGAQDDPSDVDRKQNMALNMGLKKWPE